MNDIKSKRSWLVATAAGAVGLVIGFAGISSASPSVAAPKAAVVVAADTTVTTPAPVLPTPPTNIDGSTPTPGDEGTESADRVAAETAEQTTLLAQAKVSDADARAAALVAKPGTVTESRLDDRHGTLVWHIEIKTATAFADVNVDATTGKVLDSHDETAEHQGGGMGDHGGKGGPRGPRGPRGDHGGRGDNKDPQHEADEVKNGNVEAPADSSTTAPAANA